MYVCEDNIQTTVDNKATTTTPTTTTHKHVYKKAATAVTSILL